MVFEFNEDKSKATVIPVKSGGTGATTASAAISNLDILNKVYPVGSIYMSVNSTNPSNYFGGTWVRWGQGRVPVGVNASDSNFSYVEKTGGEKTHKLTIDEMPSHVHSIITTNIYYTTGTENVSPACGGVASNIIDTNSEENNQVHNNLQPYITCYMWKRTA